MILWMILTLMVAIAAVGLTIPLVRRYDARPARGGVVEVLKAQLGEIDDQGAAGVVTPVEADGLRVEVKRRLLSVARVAVGDFQPLGP